MRYVVYLCQISQLMKACHQVEYIWRASWSTGQCLYLLTRYITFLNTVLGMIGQFMFFEILRHNDDNLDQQHIPWMISASRYAEMMRDKRQSHWAWVPSQQCTGLFRAIVCTFNGILIYTSLQTWHLAGVTIIVMLVTERESQITAAACHLLIEVQLYRFGIHTVFGTGTGLFYSICPSFHLGDVYIPNVSLITAKLINFFRNGWIVRCMLASC